MILESETGVALGESRFSTRSSESLLARIDSQLGARSRFWGISRADSEIGVALGESRFSNQRPESLSARVDSRLGAGTRPSEPHREPGISAAGGQGVIASARQRRADTEGRRREINRLGARGGGSVEVADNRADGALREPERVER